MQSDVNMIVEWCETWYMELSPEKCKVMHLGKQTNPEDYFISGKMYVLQNVKEIWAFSSCLMARGTNKSTLLHPKPTGFWD